MKDTLCIHNRRNVATFVKRWGSAASIALLDPKCSIFQIPSIEGLIGYRLLKGCAVVYGDPVCAPEDTETLAEAFMNHCHQNKWRFVFTIVSEQFVNWALPRTGGGLIEFGEELYVDPQADPKIGPQGRKLRNKISHSYNAGVRIFEYSQNDLFLEKSMDEMAQMWLAKRKGPQLFLADVNLFAERPGKRWFYALHQEKLIGVLLLNELESREGWLINLLLTAQNAPSGTSETLVTSVLEVLRKEGCRFTTFGPVPSEQLGEIVGLNALSAWFTRHAFKAVKKIFPLDNKKVYWKKFHPQSKRSYLFFSHPRIGLKESMSVLRALNFSLK